MNKELKIDVVSKDVTYKELDALLTNPIERIAKNYEKWCYECIKNVTGDDLTGKSESELREYFSEDRPIIAATRGMGLVTLVYKGHIFNTYRSQLEDI